jgi:hypothetical protein
MTLPREMVRARRRRLYQSVHGHDQSAQQRTLIGVAEIAAYLGIDADTARRALRSGAVEGARQGQASGEWLARNPRIRDAMF